MAEEREDRSEQNWSLLRDDLSPDFGLDGRLLPRLPLRVEERDPTQASDNYGAGTGYLFDSSFPPEQRRLY